MATSNTIGSLYTDGACSGNPGPGGWGVVICYADGSIHELGGGDSETTNNRMEMQAAIAALKFLGQAEQPEPVTLYTDSEYLIKGITQWINGWKKKRLDHLRRQISCQPRLVGKPRQAQFS